MNSNQLFYLITLSRYSSLRQASEYLHLTPSALTTSIKRLEEELNLPLIIRSSKGVVLTDAGYEFIKIASDFLVKVDMLKNNFQPPLNFSLKLFSTTLGALSNDFLSELICELNLKMPSVHIIYQTESYHQLCTMLSAQKITLFFMSLSKYNNIFLQDVCPQLSFVELFSSDFVLQVPKSFPIANARSLSLQDILSYPILFFDPQNDSHQLIGENFLNRFGSPKHIMTEPVYPLFRKRAESGSVISFFARLPHMSFRSPATSNTCYVPLKEDLKLSWGYFIYDTTQLSAGELWFIDYIKEQLLNQTVI